MIAATGAIRRAPRPRAGRRLSGRALLAGLLLLAGGCVAATGLYQPAKALYGQHLLARAWEAGGAKPWPWADFAAYALIEAPRIGVSAIALSEATGAAMAWGPGHVAGAAVPGAPGLAAFAGHRDSHFGFLGDLRPGDEIRVETAASRHVYRVSGAVVIDSRRWRFPVGGPERLALSTCWPLDALTPGPLRLVVFADPVAAPSAEAAAPRRGWRRA